MISSFLPKAEPKNFFSSGEVAFSRHAMADCSWSYFYPHAISYYSEKHFSSVKHTTPKSGINHFLLTTPIT